MTDAEEKTPQDADPQDDSLENSEPVENAAPDEPVTDEPVTDEPVTDEPVTDEPATDETGAHEQATDDDAAVPARAGSSGSGLLIVGLVLLVAAGLAVMVILKNIKKDLPPDGDAIFARGMAAIEAQNLEALDQAIVELETIESHQTQYSFLVAQRTMATMGEARSMQERQTRVQKVLRHLMISRNHPDLQTRSLTMAGIALSQAGQAAAAEQAWLEAVANDAKAVDAHRRLAIQYYDNGVLEKAQHHLKQVAALAPDDPRPLRLLGIINKDFARNRDALENYRESFRRDPNQPGREEALLEMSEVQIRLRKYGDALITLEQSTPSADSLAMQGECLLAQQKTREAREKAKQAIAKDSNNFRAMLLRGTIALEGRDLVIARQVLETAVKKYPTREEALFKLAQTYSQLREEQLAEKYMKAYEDLKEKRKQYQLLNIQAVREPRNAEVRYQIGKMAMELYGPQMAATWYAAALRVDPNHTAARQEIIRIQSQQRQ